MNYELIKNKYGKCSSWAIWKKRVIGDKEKDSMGDITFFNTIYELVLNPNIILVGLNISGSIENEFSNFHPISKTAHDYKIRYALEDTVFWGSYMTDIIKDYEEMISGKVMSYLSKNKSFEEKNIELFEEELKDIGSINPILIAFGNNSYKILTKYFKHKYKIYKVSHYSSCISKEKLREQFLNLEI